MGHLARNFAGPDDLINDLEPKNWLKYNQYFSFLSIPTKYLNLASFGTDVSSFAFQETKIGN